MLASQRIEKRINICNRLGRHVVCILDVVARIMLTAKYNASKNLHAIHAILNACDEVALSKSA